MASTNHVELSPSDVGFQDRYIIQEIIKEMAKNRPIDTKGKKGFKGIFDIIFLATYKSMLEACFSVRIWFLNYISKMEFHIYI